MSKITNIIFNGEAHKLTSPFGPRDAIYKNGKLISSKGQHNGADYASTTSLKKLPQYAIEDGYVFAAAKSNSDGALYTWIVYPRIKKSFISYHLSSYSVKAGQKVARGTPTGITGSTGNSTGVHLHLGERDLSGLTDEQINNMTWDLLRSCPYIDPEKFVYTEPEAEKPVKATPAPKAEEPVKATSGKAWTKKANASAAKATNTYNHTYKVYANGGLRLRTKPGATDTKRFEQGGTIITVIPNGAKVRCYKYYSEVKGTVWLYVTYGNYEGFVCKDYLRLN